LRVGWGRRADALGEAGTGSRSPLVILADEPTGNLDRDNAAGVLAALSAAASVSGNGGEGEGDGTRHGERTVLIATHDPFVIERADEVLSL
jgi:ABC-type lipoprotein export system ATPase subunit